MERNTTTYTISMAERIGAGRLFRSGLAIGDDIRSRLYAQLLNSPTAALMGSLCSLIILTTANIRSPSAVFTTFTVLEIALAVARLLEWRRRRAIEGKAATIDVSWSALLSVLWCGLQGALAFTIMSGSDPVLQVLSATTVMALLGPVCSRNYAAPAFATLLLLLLDIPFVAGAVVSDQPSLSVIVLLTPPFVFGARQIINTFHETLLKSLLAEEENLQLALHDSLTGIYNRQGMDERLSRLTASPGQTMAIISLDLDGFKGINDEYGHGAGDTVLVEVARRITLAAGEKGIVARMGGDEFMVVVRDCDVDHVRKFGEALVEAICNEAFVIAPDVTVRVGASAGFACLPEDALTAHELRIRADRALYDAKDAGKRTCRRYSEAGPTAARRA